MKPSKLIIQKNMFVYSKIWLSLKVLRSFFFRINLNEIYFLSIQLMLIYITTQTKEFNTGHFSINLSLNDEKSSIALNERLELHPRAQKILWSLEYEDRPPIKKDVG